LSLVAKEGVFRLRGQGIEPDLDDVAALHELGKRVERNEGAPSLSVLGNPVRAGNCTLWPLTIGAEQWLNGRALPWFEGNGTLEFYACAFAYAMARTPEVLIELVEAKQAAKVVEAWAGDCSATRDELSDALDKLLPEESVPGKEDKFCPECMQDWPPDRPDEDPNLLPPELDQGAYFSLIESLIKTYPGTTMEYWTWTPPQSVAFRLLQASADSDANSNGQVSSGSNMQATHRFETALRSIRDKHLARAKREKVEAE